MALEFCLAAASSFVAPLLVDYLVKPIERRIRYLFRFHKIVQELHQNKEDLAAKETKVKEDVEEAKLQIRTQVIYDQVDEWLPKAENALKDVEDLDSKIKENKRCFRLCPNWCWRYQLSQEIENKTLEIIDLVKESKFERDGHRAKLPNLDLVTSKNHVDSKSSDAAFNKIMENVGGEVKGFDRVIMVTVSETLDIEKMQNKIADDIDLNFEKKTGEVKAAELWSRLSNGKFLVILDDLWKEWNDDGDLRKIGIPLVKDEKGCKIILTTRNYNVCQHMECEETVQVKVLEDDEAWTLFEMNAGLKKADSRVIGEAKKIVKECKGLPLAIVTLARALKNAREKLEGSELMEIRSIQKETDKNVYMSLKISYEHLEDKMAQTCFLLCALYPEDHSINVEDLANSIEKMRNEVLSVIDHLKDYCLLENVDDERYVKLHDIVHDVALWIVSEEKSGFVIKSRLELLNKNSESCKAISLLDSEEKNLPDRLALSKLEILLLKNCYVQGTCFLGMTELKVLSLTIANGSSRVISLYALRFLPKLRALHLENFEDFMFLGNLMTLEILSLRGSNSEGLAKQLGRLENLKMLDLMRLENLSCPPSVIQRLSQLKELYLPGLEYRKISNDIFLETIFLKRLTRLSLEVSSLHFPPDFEFPELESYTICINHSSSRLDYRFEEARSLIVEKVFPYIAVSQLLGNLESLVVSVTIEECSNLKVVFQMEEVEENGAPLLSNLKILCLEDLPDLSCIWELPTQHVRLESLVYLTIRKCPRLKSLFSLSLAQSLVLLEELDMRFCDELKQIVTELEGDEGEISSAINSHTSLCFPKLTKLNISSCPRLEYIFPTSLASHGLQGLTRNICCCPKLKQVFRVAKVSMLKYQQSLRSLSSFSMSGCPLLTDSVVHLEAEKASIKDEYVECLTNKTQQKVSVSMILRNLKQVSIGYCSNLKVVFQMEEVEENEAPLLSNLKILNLEGLPDLSCIWELPTQHVRLESLVELTIKHCPRLKSLFSLSLAQSLVLLEKLKIFYCFELKQIVTELEGDEGEISSAINSHTSLCFPKLTKLYISICDGLEYIFPTSLASHGLQGLTLGIHWCPKLKQVFRVANDSMLQYQQSLRSLSSFSITDCPLLTDSVVHLEAEKASIKGVRLSAFKDSFKTSKELRLSDIKDHNLVPEANEDGLNGVTSLQLENCEDLECLVDTTATATKNGPTSAFTHLETLFIEDMDGLEALCKGQPPQGFLKNLKHLEVRECCKLQVLGELLHDGEQNQEHPLSNLQSLKLYQLPALRWIFKGSPHSFTLQILKVVYINGCGKLKSLLSPSLIQSLVLLEQFEIQHCNELETLFADPEIDGEIESKPSSLPLCLPKLKTLSIEGCAKLEYVVPKPSSLPLRLPKLNTLSIEDCAKLEYVVPITLAQGLPALESLSVSCCDELKQVFGMPNEQDGVQHHGSLLLPSLQYLELDGLRNLTSFVPQNYIVKAPSLKRLGANDCPKVINIPIQQANNQLELTIQALTFLMEDIDSEDVNLSDTVNTQLIQKSPDFEYITLGNFEQLFQLQGGNIISSLEKMELFNVIRLRDIWKGPIQVATNLREIRVHCCNNLTYIFPETLIPYLPQLSILKIKSCVNLKKIIGNDDILESSSSSQGPQLEMKMVFPQLKEIELENLSKLESFSPMGYHLEFPCLHSLDIKECSKMITMKNVAKIILVPKSRRLYQQSTLVN
ncbi:hypothetical protein ERO13_D01G038100v2 [Gossypium hirsutum]|nr:hypothetical protein ERO13_D01G038100v2 [Gossypium hirsutum]